MRDYILVYILAHTLSLEVWVRTPLLFSDFIGKCLGKLLCIMNTGVRHYLTKDYRVTPFLTPYPSPKNFPWRFIANNRNIHTCQAVHCSRVCGARSCRGWKGVRRLRTDSSALVRLTPCGHRAAARARRDHPYTEGFSGFKTEWGEKARGDLRCEPLQQ